MLMLFAYTVIIIILNHSNCIAMSNQENQFQCASSNNKLSLENIWRKITGKFIRDMTCFDYYAFNETSIYFRWNPPVSSNGTISMYKIEYVTNSMPTNSVTFKPTPCLIWPWMHCKSIQDLISNARYQFDISVQFNYSSQWIIQAQTGNLRRRTFDPEPPNNLKSFWDKQYNLTVTWEYPNKTNGILKSFIIYFNKTRYVIPVDTPRLKHNYSFNFMDSMDVDVMDFSFVCQNMDFKVSRLLNKRIDFPPPTPELSQNPVLIRIVNKVKVEISIPELNNPNIKSYIHVIVAKIASGGDPSVHSNQTNFIKRVVDMDPNMIAWIAKEYHSSLHGCIGKNLIIGDMSKMFSNATEQEITNWKLPRGEDLKIFIIVSNKRKNFLRFKSYLLEITLPSPISPFVYISVLMLLIIIALCVYVIRMKKIRFVRL